jgi:hypothetical protein
LIANKQSEYKRLGAIINDARLAGIIDWEAIEDRTRFLRKNTHWESPDQIISAAINSYKRDVWEGQKFRPEVWIEKDALVGIIENICTQLDVPYFACWGYTSQSEMWVAAQRMLRRSEAGQTTVIIHLGDHDPSGIDMTRDIEERLSLFAGAALVRRIALNMNQVQKYSPPPNPAKLTDTRASSYIDDFGTSSWELDALDPKVIVDLVIRRVLHYRDDKIYKKALRRQKKEIEHLKSMLGEG